MTMRCPSEQRLRSDLPWHELRHARVRTARKDCTCIYCDHVIVRGEVYARISEIRLPVCHAHFDTTDIVEVTRA